MLHHRERRQRLQPDLLEGAPLLGESESPDLCRQCGRPRCYGWCFACGWYCRLFVAAAGFMVPSFLLLALMAALCGCFSGRPVPRILDVTAAGSGFGLMWLVDGLVRDFILKVARAQNRPDILPGMQSTRWILRSVLVLLALFLLNSIRPIWGVEDGVSLGESIEDFVGWALISWVIHNYMRDRCETGALATTLERPD